VVMSLQSTLGAAVVLAGVVLAGLLSGALLKRIDMGL
jgi:hypothetical protein